MRFGLIPANRGFFSDALAAKMRTETIKAMEKAGMEVIVPDESMTKVGCVETIEEAKKTGQLFKDKQVDGIVVAAVNFGDEQGVAYTVMTAGLDVPIFIFGCQEEEVLTPTTERRDSFCGLISIAEALRQTGKKYTVASTPICFPSDQSLANDLSQFAATCRVLKGIKGARYGQIGLRPDAFWTCRYDEASMQKLGVTVVTVDMAEIITGVQNMQVDADVTKKISDIKGNCDTSAADEATLTKIAKFELFLERTAKEKGLDALAVQCWPNLQLNIGISACGTLGRLNNNGLPTACEADMLGAFSMHALALASQTPATLADWNNVHNEDPDLVNLWHCGVVPVCYAKTQPKMGPHGILAGTFGEENSFGVVEFEMKTGPATLFRITQEDGEWKTLTIHTEFEENKAKTFGAYGWCRIDGLNNFYRDVIVRNFPHHVGLTYGLYGSALYEAFGNYMGFGTYVPGQTTSGIWTPTNPFIK